MCQTFWSSKPRDFRKKWEARIRSGLSPKRKFQLTRYMAEFFARQKGPMEEIAKAKRAEFQQQLDQNIKTAHQLNEQLRNCQINIEQLRGAIVGVDKILAAAAGPAKPNLSLVPPLPEAPKLEMQPVLPPENA